jgi:hypothetical protein
MFQLAVITIATHQLQLCGSCGADKTCVSLRIVAKMCDRLLEQRINIKFRVKLSLYMKHGVFNTIPKADDKVFNGYS